MITLSPRLKKSRLILGLMSGTSHDGVDSSLVRVSGLGKDTAFTLVHHSHLRFSPGLRHAIHASFQGSTEDVCRLNFELGEIFAKAALMCVDKAGVSMKRIDAIASHGQTVCHVPPEKNRRGSTLQIGEAAVIAARTGVPVISDFRVADMAAGGHGAPLVPYADYLLFRGRRPRAVQNIGGIANVTVVTPSLFDVIAFDTGPGNALIDEAMNALFKKPYDKDGRIARKGVPDDDLLDTLLRHPYFSSFPPKSTGRELFGTSFLETVVKHKRLGAEDLVCTLTHLTARSIRDAYERFIFPNHTISEIIVSGGGTKNPLLMTLLGGLFAPVPIRPIDDFGIPSSAKEALSFALLANETLAGRPSNLPAVTGAARPVILGKITLP